MTHKNNQPPKSSNLFATVDLGSNSFRLLIAKIRQDGILTPVDQIKSTVRLAGGLDSDNNLTEAIQQNALLVLHRFSERLVNFPKTRVRVVATSALRVAKNAAAFIAIASKVLGFKIEVIAGTEEARLIYLGVMHTLTYQPTQKRLIIDIGGGSTEFIIGCGYQPQIMESLTIGCVSFSNNYFTAGKLNIANFNNAIFAARSKIQTMEHLLLAQHDWHEVIGSSGTARVLYELCMRHKLSDTITYASLDKLKQLLIGQKNSKNLAIIGVKEDRMPVIAGGLAIMLAIFEELQIQEMHVADGSLREGVMYDLLGRTSSKDLRIKTVSLLKTRYELDLGQSKRVMQFASKVYNSVNDDYKLDEFYTKLMNWAVELYEIGLAISHNDYHKHGAYILANTDLAGFSKSEQAFMADLVRSHRGNLAKALISIKQRHKLKAKFLLMTLAFRLAVIINRNRKTLTIKEMIKINIISDKQLELQIDNDFLTTNPLTHYSLDEEIKQWQDYGIDLKIIT